MKNASNFTVIHQNSSAAISEFEDTAISVAHYNQLSELFQKQHSTNGTTGGSNSENTHILLAGKFCMSSSLLVNSILDTGATDHICSSLELFNNFHKYEDVNKFITVLDGKKVKICHIRDIVINQDIILHNLLHVPDFKFNLVSVRTLCKDLHKL